MAAAMAAGKGGYDELVDQLADLAGKPNEFAAFGAAFGLMKLEDRRALPAFAEVMHGANYDLAQPSLHNLRSVTGKTLQEGDPTTPSEWRARAVLWREELAASQR